MTLKHYNHWSLVGQMGGSEIKVNLFTGGEIRDKRVAGLKKKTCVIVKRVVTVSVSRVRNSSNGSSS